MPKGRKGRRNSSSKRIAKKTQKMMKGSCMWGGDAAPYSSNASGDEAYARAIFGDRGSQVTDGMGGNHIKMNDPAVAWKGGQRGGGEGSAVIPANANITSSLTLAQNSATEQTITWTTADPVQVSTGGGSRGGSMLGAAIVPAVLLAANQLYKPSRGNKMRGSRKTMKKYGKRRR